MNKKIIFRLASQDPETLKMALRGMSQRQLVKTLESVIDGESVIAAIEGAINDIAPRALRAGDGEEGIQPPPPP